MSNHNKFSKEQKSWNSINTVKDFFKFIEDPELDVRNFMLEICDLSKSGWWIIGNVNFDIDVQSIIKAKPQIKASDVSTITRIPCEQKHHDKFGYTNGYDRFVAQGELNKIVEALGFEPGYHAVINNQPPAGVLHRHSDYITTYMYARNDEGEFENMDKPYDKILRQPKGSKPIYRCFVALDDWHPGQIVYFEPNFWTHWKKGDVMFFDWRNTPHSSANTGDHQRPLLKITGYLKNDKHILESRHTGEKKQYSA